MGIYHYPVPPPNMGARQPHQARQLTPSLLDVRVDPPPSTLDGPNRIPATIVAMWQPDPWTYLYYGTAGQPYMNQRMSPGIPGQSVDQPPFSHENRSAEVAKLITLWQPDPWLYSQIGKRQAYEGRQLNPGIPGVTNDPPPTTLGGPVALKMQLVIQQQPDPWVYAYEGGPAPYMPRLPDPQIPGRSVDLPPSVLGGPNRLALQLAAMAQPDPWTYNFDGNAQPYTKRQMAGDNPAPVNPPPPILYGPTTIRQQLAMLWQPDPWTYNFYAAGQPFARRLLSPQLTAVLVNEPPYTLGGPLTLRQQIVNQQQPDPWVYYNMGGPGPYLPKIVAAGIPGRSADPPPSTLGGPRQLPASVVAINWPDWSVVAWPFTFMGARQPYDPRKIQPGVPGQSADQPVPSLVGGPRAQKALSLLIAQPDWGYSSWPYDFMGKRQPYQAGQTNPSVGSVIVNNPPFTHFARTAAYRSIRDAWNPPPPDFVMQLYASRIQPFPGVNLNRPTARGYVIL